MNEKKNRLVEESEAFALRIVRLYKYLQTNHETVMIPQCFMFHASCFMSPDRVASFDGLPDVNRAPYKLALTSCKALKNGVVWLRYKKG